VKRAAERIREREAAATIIDLRRASARKRMARSRVKKKEAKRAAETRIRERKAEAGDGINPSLSASSARGRRIGIFRSVLVRKVLVLFEVDSIFQYHK